MRILMFSNLFPPVVSGSSTQSAALSRELARRGHTVAVITAQTSLGGSERERTDGYAVHRMPSIRLPKMGISFNFPWLTYTFTPGNLRRIAQIIEDFRPDVLHLHNHMFDLAFSGVWMSRKFKIPAAVTIHTMVKHAKPIYNVVLYPADRIFLKRFVIDHCDSVISPDINVQSYVEESFGRTDGALVPYGIALPELAGPEKVAELRQRYGLQNKRVVLSLGHVNENRTRKDVVEAFPRVLANIPEAVLLIVGTEGSEVPRTLARQLGIDNKVVFTGAVPHNEVPAFLAMADIEAHWLNQDGPERTSLGIASLEAMSAGIPILAAANPNTYGPGLLADNVNLLLAQPGRPELLAEMMIALLNDQAMRQRIGESASRTVRENFSWESVCAKTVQAYESAQARFALRSK